MNPRQRVVSALDRREPDRFPIDLGGTNVTSLEVDAYTNLRQYLGLQPDASPEISHIQQGTVYPKADLLRHYGIDCRPVTMKRAPRWVAVEKRADGSWIDEYGILWRPSVHSYYDSVTCPLADSTLADLELVRWPDAYDPARVEGLREQARRLYEGTEYAVVADIMCRGPFEQACKLRGYERFCLDLALDGRFAQALLAKITDLILGLWDAYLAAVGDYVQVVCQGDDLGTQTGLFISPQMYRRFIKPCHRRIFEFVHARTPAKIFFHSCGSVYDILPDLIEAGVDVLNPVQYRAAKMDLARLKREFGCHLSFWGGGIDTQQVLPQASPQQIEREVSSNVETLAAGGGFVFALTHNVQPDVSPDRLDLVYRTALKACGAS